MEFNDKHIDIENANNSTDERTSIINFVNRYKGLSSEKGKQALIMSVVQDNHYYVPYAEKCAYAQNIVFSSVTEDKNQLIYNTPKQYYLYTCYLLKAYTKLLIDQSSFLSDYDLLDQNGLLTTLIEAMPQDKKTFDIILDMVRNDFERNHLVTQFNVSQIIEGVKQGIVEGTDLLLQIINNYAQSVDIEKIINSVSITDKQK